MNSLLVDAYTCALRAMEGGAPKGLVRRAVLEAEDIDPGLDVSEARLREYLASSGPNDRLRLGLHLNLARWDNAPIASNPWTNDTRPNTMQRRMLVIRLLGLDMETS